LGNIKGKHQLENLEIYEKTALKLIFKIKGVRVFLDSSALGYGPAKKPYKYGDL
jgi:hypothetical protein